MSSEERVAEVSFNAQEETAIRTRLIRLQEKITEAKVPVVVLLCGPNGSGKNATLEILREWMDQRRLNLHAYERRNVRQDPIEFRRYWCDTPENGYTGLFVSSWYSDPLTARSYGKMDDGEFHKALDRCVLFEKMLADGGAVLCKIWFRKSGKAQEKFLCALDDDPYESWRVMPDDWKNCRFAEKFDETTKMLLRYTGKPFAPWFEITDGSLSERVRSALDVFCTRVESEIAARAAVKPPKNKEIKLHKAAFLKKVDMGAALSKNEYNVLLPYMRARLNALLTEARNRGKKVVLAFEGPDASGKGGVISRLASSVFVRDCTVFPIAAPTKQELAHNFLWRFWDRLREQNLLTVFDRSWYGRVLVERLEHFATDAEWSRAYDEINAFEKQLTEGDTIVVKFLLYITADEQLARFKARQEVAYKTWKIGDEDWRNRDKWDQYETAFDDMIAKTDTKYAPWYVIPDNNKKFGRIETMRLLCERLEKVLDYVPDLPKPDLPEKAPRKNGKKKN